MILGWIKEAGRKVRQTDEWPTKRWDLWCLWPLKLAIFQVNCMFAVNSQFFLLIRWMLVLQICSLFYSSWIGSYGQQGERTRKEGKWGLSVMLQVISSPLCLKVP
jgi:hypothetical protein